MLKQQALGSGFLVDKQGHVVIGPEFDYAGGFEDGLTGILIGNWKTGTFGYIDKRGHFVIPPHFNLIGGFLGERFFSKGLAAVQSLSSTNCQAARIRR